MNSYKELESKDLIDISVSCPDIVLDIKYATKDNLTGEKLYKKPVCFLHKKVIDALKLCQSELEKDGLGLKIWDAYRPMNIQNKLVRFVDNADFTPSVSNHSKGIAVDLTIINLETKQELEMPTQFDDLSDKAYENYSKLDKNVFDNREKLKSIMKKYGFTVYPYEWWHYDFLELESLEPLNIEI